MNGTERKLVVGNRRRHQLDEFKEEEEEEVQRDIPLSFIDTTTNDLSAEQIQEFFKATEDGSVERLEMLFNQKLNADPNMTRFTESLLMAAIRTQRYEVAEFLIDQLAINVKHTADLHEFRSHSDIPIRHRSLSCRDLAYEKGMMELVDLIDITSDEVTPNIKRYLRKRLQSRLTVIHQAYLKRLRQCHAHSPLPLNETKENQMSSTEEKIRLTTMLPSIHQPQRSFIEETIDSISRTNEKSIDETGQKKFRFSNYSLRFRLVETTDSKRHLKEPSKTNIPSLPLISVSPSFTLKRHSRASISQASTRLSMRDSRTSMCRSALRATSSQLSSRENRATITPTAKQFLTKRVPMQHSYIPQQQQSTFYNQPRRFLPVTLKATAIGLPSNKRIIRD